MIFGAMKDHNAEFDYAFEVISETYEKGDLVVRSYFPLGEEEMV